MEFVTGVVILDQVRQSRESMVSIQTPHTHPLSVADLSPLPASKTSVWEIFIVFHWKIALVEKILHVRVVLIFVLLHTITQLSTRVLVLLQPNPTICHEVKTAKKGPVLRLNRLRPLNFMLCFKAAAGFSHPLPRPSHLSLISSITII